MRYLYCNVFVVRRNDSKKYSNTDSLRTVCWTCACKTVKTDKSIAVLQYFSQVYLRFVVVYSSAFHLCTSTLNCVTVPPVLWCAVPWLLFRRLSSRYVHFPFLSGCIIVDVVIGVRYYWIYAQEGNERSYIDRKGFEQLRIHEMLLTQIVVSLNVWTFKCFKQLRQWEWHRIRQWKRYLQSRRSAGSVKKFCYQRREENQLDATECLIALIICSTCFGHLYAHHQDLETILVLFPHMVCNALLEHPPS